MTVQLELDFSAQLPIATCKVVSFPVERMAGRARFDARMILKRPLAKRGWHTTSAVSLFIAERLEAGLSVQASEADGRMFRQMVIDEMSRLATIDYLFGPDHEAQSA